MHICMHRFVFHELADPAPAKAMELSICQLLSLSRQLPGTAAAGPLSSAAAGALAAGPVCPVGAAQGAALRKPRRRARPPGGGGVEVGGEGGRGGGKRGGEGRGGGGGTGRWGVGIDPRSTQIDPARAPDRPQTDPDSSQPRCEIGPRSIRGRRRINIDAQVDPNGPKIGLTSTEIGPGLSPDRPRVDPQLTPKIPQFIVIAIAGLAGSH